MSEAPPKKDAKKEEKPKKDEKAKATNQDKKDAKEKKHVKDDAKKAVKKEAKKDTQQKQVDVQAVPQEEKAKELSPQSTGADVQAVQAHEAPQATVTIIASTNTPASTTSAVPPSTFSAVPSSSTTPVSTTIVSVADAHISIEPQEPAKLEPKAAATDVGNIRILKIKVEGQVFDVPELLAKLSSSLSDLITQAGGGTEITVPNHSGAKSDSFVKAIQYLHNHISDPAPLLQRHDDDRATVLTVKEKEMLNAMSSDAILDLVAAAHILGMECLIKAGCKHIALIKGKPIEEIRQIFKVQCDFKAEELQKIDQEMDIFEKDNLV